MPTIITQQHHYMLPQSIRRLQKASDQGLYAHSLQMSGAKRWMYLSLHGRNVVLKILKEQLDIVYFVLQKNVNIISMYEGETPC